MNKYEKNIPSWLLLVLFLSGSQANEPEVHISESSTSRSHWRHGPHRGWRRQGPSGPHTIAAPYTGTMTNVTSVDFTVPTQKREERYYEPYWQDGNWVFERYSTSTTLTPLHPESSTSATRPRPHPNPFKLNRQQRYTSFATHMFCNPICPKVFADFGQVCAGRLEVHLWWRDESRTFSSICHMEQVNCFTNSKLYQVKHRGPCEPHSPHRQADTWYADRLPWRANSWLTVPERERTYQPIYVNANGLRRAVTRRLRAARGPHAAGAPAASAQHAADEKSVEKPPPPAAEREKVA